MEVQEAMVEVIKVAGGAGNPGGSSYGNYNNRDGTGGLLIMYANKILNNGDILSEGTMGGRANASGGSSGGGSINLFYKDSFNNVNTISSNGGNVAIGIDLGGGGNVSGGSGGDGSVTVGNISTGTFVKQEIQRNP